MQRIFALNAECARHAHNTVDTHSSALQRATAAVAAAQSLIALSSSPQALQRPPHTLQQGPSEKTPDVSTVLAGILSKKNKKGADF